MKPTFNKLLQFSIASIFILVLGLNQCISQSCTFSERFEQTSSAYSHDFGGAVAAYDSHVVVGAQNDSGATSSSGSAYYYNWDGTSWIEEELTTSSTQDGDRFGAAVDITDSRIIVGAPATIYGGGTTSPGAAYIFMRNGSSWDEHQLIPSNGQAADGFGFSVSIEGDRAVVGSPFADPLGFSSGAIYIFEYNGTNWVETSIPLASDGVSSDRFGTSVSLESDRIVVGANNDDNNGFSDSGSVYVYDWDGTIWGETKIIASDGGDNHYYGSSVSVAGDRIVVGAYRATGVVATSGAAYVYDYDGTSWVETGKLFDINGSANDNFGSSVDLDFNQLAVGAFFKDNINGQDAGEAYLYTYDGSTWTESNFIASDGDLQSYFGYAVAISTDYFIAGATGVNDIAPFAGATYMYVTDGITWTEYKNSPADYGEYLSFGRSVDIDNDRFVVGANQRFPSGQTFGPGKAWLYEYDGSSWTEQEFNPTNGQFADNYGHVVSVSGDRFVVGAPYDDEQDNNAGAVYIYDYDGSSWVETKLFDSDLIGGGGFGWDLSLSGDTLIVGTLDERAYIYFWNGTTWVEDIITPTGGSFGAFGQSVDILDDRAIIGAYFTDNQFSADGAALIFDYDGTSWIQSTILYPANPSNTGNFGADVAITQDHVMIGGSLYADRVWFYDFDGTNWNEHEFSVSLNGNRNPVAIDGNRAVLGSDNVGGFGEIFTFQWFGECWVEEGTMQSESPYDNNQFGNAVAMDDDRMLIGAPGISDHVELWECVDEPSGPTAVCYGSAGIALDDTGNITILPENLDNGSFSPCGIVSMSVSPDVFDCTQIGDHTIALTVTDNSGETSSCSLVMSIIDATPPELTCLNLTLPVPASGIVTITEADVLDSAFDNCGSYTLSLNQTTFNCIDGNYPTYILTATDPSGNVTNCGGTLTLEETEMPDVYCEDITVSLNEFGVAIVAPSDVQQKMTDPLDGFVGMEGADPLACATSNDQYDASSNNMTLTASDPTACGGGGADECFQISHIYQTTVPHTGKVCFEYDVSDLGVGDVFAYSVGVDWSIFTPDSQTLSDFTTTIMDSSNGTVGSNETICVYVSMGQEFSLIVYSDYYDNGSTESFTINGLLETSDPTNDWDLIDTCTPAQDGGDNVNPGPGQTHYDEHIINLSCETTYRIASTTDWGDGQGYLYDSALNPADICENLVSWDGDSGNGFETIVEFNPTIGQDYYFYLSTWVGTQLGNYSLEVSNGSFGPGQLSIEINNLEITYAITSDNCKIENETLSTSFFDCNSLGSHLVTYTAFDSYGNESSCDVTIEVVDDIFPTILCQDITVQLDSNGEAQILPEDVQDFPLVVPQEFIPLWGAVECPDSNNSFDPALGEMTLTATDHADYGGSGANTCLQFSNMYQFTFPYDSEICFDWEITNAGIGDKFGYSVTYDWTSVSAVPSNLNTAVILLGDSSTPGGPGMTNTCVNATAGTHFALIVYTDYSGNGNSLGFGALTAEIENIQFQDLQVDNCDVNYSLDISDFTCDEIGSNTVILTATDGSGNAVTCSANVVVEDQSPPIVSTQDLVVDVDSDGNAVITAAMVDDGSFDNCAIDMMSLDITNFTCADIPGAPTIPYSTNLVNTLVTNTNFIRDLTIHNDLIYCSQRPTDQINVFDMSGVLQFSFGSSGTGVGLFGEPNGIAFDSGGFIYVSDRIDAKILKFNAAGTFISEFSTPAIEDIFIYNDIIYAALDNDGKVSTYDLNGTFLQDIFAFSGVSSLYVENNKIYAADKSSSSTFKVYDLSGNLLLSKAVGGWANEISADPNGYIYLARWNDNLHDIYDENGNQIYTGAPSILGSTFYNGQFFGSTISGTFYTFDVDYGNPGDYNTVVLTVTDQQGLSTTAIANVTVRDIEAPTVSCQDITVQVAADGTPTVVDGIDVDDGSMDNCGIATYELNVNSFTINEKGVNPVVLTVTDENGITASCFADVTVDCACDPASSSLVPNSESGLHIAAVKNDDGQFTHYCDASGRLLLSIDSPTASNILASEVTIDITPGGFYYEQYCVGSGGSEDGSCFISSGDGAVVLCRSWDVDNTSADAVVRFYFDQGDLDIINSELYNLGLDPMTDPNQMWFYKVINGIGHQKPEDLAVADVTIIDNDGSAVPSTTNWVMGMAASSYYAEYEVSTFSGGGGGGAQGGSSPLCPTIEATISGDEILPAAGTSDVYVDIQGGVAPYVVTLSDGTMVTNYNAGDPISVTFTATTTYNVATVNDSSNCPISSSMGTATKYVTTGDVTPPVAICQDLVVDLSAYGTASISFSDIDNGSTDNEGIATISIDQNILDCNSSSLVTLTVTDLSGNVDQCTATVTINDPLNVCCPSSRSIEQAPSIAKEYQADQTIDSDAEIKSGTGVTNIIMHAGTQICLEPGFEVQVGALFEAYIGPCN